MINKEKIEFNDQISDNILKIKDLFPNTVTESESGIKIDFDKLKEELSKDLMDSKEERYQMTWPGKKASIKISNQPTDKTLIPDRDSSVEFDTTQNIYIEGDNLEALKLLKKSYEGKIKCIYIDPPYNTGKDFVYKDSFDQDKNDYLSDTNQLNEEEGKLVNNPETSGRFHSNWLSMMYPRLKLARDLLTEDGLIFISIDDNEQANLKKICDEIFGESNLVENYIWESNFRPDNSSKFERENAQYILCFTKNKSKLQKLIGSQKKTEGLPSLTKNKNTKTSVLNFKKEYLENFISDGIYEKGILSKGYELLDNVKIHDGKILNDFRLSGKFIWSQEYLDKQVKEGTFIVFKTNSFVPYSKKLETGTLAPTSIIPNEIVGDVLEGNSDINQLFGQVIFNHPKPVSLIRYLLKSIIYEPDNNIFLDFFSGSGSSAHGLLNLNSEDNGNRKYIMVQIPEKTPEDSEANKVGFKNICEIGKERIRRAAKKIKEETNADIDYGFKVFKVSDSIINSEIELSPNELLQNSLKFENIREDLSNEDLLYSAILKTGLPLDSKVIKENISNNEFFTVVDSENNNVLVACFDKDIDFNENIIKFIASQNPLRVYFRDSSFKSDSEKINFEQKLNELTSESVEIYVL